MNDVNITSFLMPKLYLIRWTGEHIFLVSSAEKTRSPDACIGRRGSITLFSITHHTFTILNIHKSVNCRLIIERWSPVWFLRLASNINNFAIAENSPVTRYSICWRKRLQYGVVQLAAVYRPIDDRYLM